jgi:hypothetical protein
MYTVPSDIYNQVEPYAKQYGVPDSIWEDVAFTESSFNPQAQNGNAYGLFQLLTPGGHGDLATRAGVKPDDLKRADINAKYEMPFLQQAWVESQSTFDGTNLNWWINFAVDSGHPGGSKSNPQTIQEAKLLMKNYQGDPHMREEFKDPTLNAVNQIGSSAPFGLEPQTIVTIVGIFLLGIVVIVIGFFLLKGGS